eukprot:jgi/Astpho2/2922/fgenesh1_pg.00050_%23_163_t
MAQSCFGQHTLFSTCLVADKQEVSTALLAHARQVQRSRGSLTAEELRVSTAELLRALQKFPAAAERIQGVQVDQPPAMADLLSDMHKLRRLMQKRLNTTVEEANSNASHYEEVCRREKKALKEQEMLEQQLRLDRRERHNELLILTNAQEQARLELQETQDAAQRRAQQMDEAAVEERAHDAADYDVQHAQLVTEVQQLRASLAQLRADHKATEEQLRRRKAKNMQEVEVWIQKYDEDMGVKELEHQEEQTALNEVQAHLKHFTEAHSVLHAERMVHEESIRKAAEEQRAREDLERRRQHAARVIQRRWRLYKSAKEAERKKQAAADKKNRKGSAKPASAKKK